MQDAKTLTFTAIIAALVSAAAALLFYLGLLPKLLLAVPFVLVFILAALLIPLAWVQLRCIRPGQLFWGKAVTVLAFIALVIALIVLAVCPSPCSLWSAVLIFAFFASFLLALALVVYLLIAFWDALADR